MIEIRTPEVIENARVEIFQVWAAHGDNGGSGTAPVIGYFDSYGKADAAAKGRGWYGGNGNVSDHTAIKVNDKCYLLARNAEIDLNLDQKKRDEELRQATLASLTDEQKRVLGLKA